MGTVNNSAIVPSREVLARRKKVFFEFLLPDYHLLAKSVSLLKSPTYAAIVLLLNGNLIMRYDLIYSLEGIGNLPPLSETAA